MASSTCDITSMSSHTGTSRIGVLSPSELNCLIKDEQKKMIIIDTRPGLEYDISHIHNSIRAATGSFLIRRLKRGKATVAEVLSDSGRVIFEARSPDSIIVVLDNSSTKLIDVDSMLYQIIVKLSESEKNSVFFLCGGFSAVKQSFPDLVFKTDIVHTLGHQLRQQPVIPETSSISQILPNLFLGNQQGASDKALIDAHGIKWIVNVTTDCPNFHIDDPTINYLRIPILDTWNQGICQYFQSAIDFINAGIASGASVLIHCAAGISRSATITIAYLMHSQQWTLKHTYAHVKAARRIINPNLDFLGHLLKYERDIGIVPTSPLFDLFT